MSEFFTKFGYYIAVAVISTAFTIGVYSAKSDGRINALEQFKSRLEDRDHIDETVYQVRTNTQAILDMQQRLYQHNGKVDTELQKIETDVATINQNLRDLRESVQTTKP